MHCTRFAQEVEKFVLILLHSSVAAAGLCHISSLRLTCVQIKQECSRDAAAGMPEMYKACTVYGTYLMLQSSNEARQSAVAQEILLLSLLLQH